MWKFVYIGYVDDYYVYSINAYKRDYREVYRVPGFKQRYFEITGLIYSLSKKSFIKKNMPNFGKKFLLERVIDKKTRCSLGKDDKICFFVSALKMRVLGIKELPEYLHREYPNCKVILDFDDKVDHYCQNVENDLAEVKTYYDVVVSYNEFDVAEYGLYKKLPLMKYYKDILPGQYPECDIFFIGKDKGRLNQIVDIFEQCQDLGLKCEFYVTDVPQGKRKYDGLIHYIRRMDYVEILMRDRCTKCILNLVQDGASGVTLRDSEAIGMNKLLLTNGKSIERYGFYSPNMVIPVEDIANNVDVIKHYDDKKSAWKGYKEYSPKNFYETLGEYLDSL